MLRFHGGSIVIPLACLNFEWQHSSSNRIRALFEISHGTNRLVFFLGRLLERRPIRVGAGVEWQETLRASSERTGGKALTTVNTEVKRDCTTFLWTATLVAVK